MGAKPFGQTSGEPYFEPPWIGLRLHLQEVEDTSLTKNQV